MLTVALALVFLSSCDSKPEPKKVVEAPVKPKPADESRRFPKANLTGTIVVDDHLLGKPFMPGGTLAKYKRGQTEYDMFLAKTASANDAALLLPDWRTVLTDAKLIPSFGGYYGLDAGRPVFVFAKGPWIVGVAGLPEKDADAEARKLASVLQ